MLFRLVLGCFLPGAVGTAILFAVEYQRRDALLTSSTIATARALAQAVDSQLQRALALAHALATSRNIAERDLASFHAQAAQALESSGIGATVVLLDREGRNLVNTRRTYGVPLPAHGNRERLAEVFRTGEAAIADVFTGSVTGLPVVGVYAPVMERGQVSLVVFVGLEPPGFARILQSEHLPPAWVATILDGQGRIVARSLNGERFIGLPPVQGVARAVRERREGSVAAPTLEGVDALHTFSRASLSGWNVNIAIPEKARRADLWHSLWPLAVSMLLLFSVSLALTRHISRRISASVQALIRPAEALGMGEAVEVPPIDVEEAASVVRSLSRAADLLAKRERELRESEARFRTIIDAVPQMVWSALPDGGHDYFNRQWYAFTGLPPGSTDGDRWLELFAEEDHPSICEKWGHSLASGEPYEIEYRLRHRDGEYRWVLGRAEPVRDAGGRIMRWMGTCTDIHGQKLAEAALAESSAKYRSLFANMAEGFALCDLLHDPAGNPSDVRVLEANEAFHRQTGLPADIIGKPLSQFMPALEGYWLQAYDSVVRTGQPVRLENRNTGTGRIYDLNAYRPEPGRFAIVFRDITEIKAAQAALEDTEQRYNALFNNRTNAVAHLRVLADAAGQPEDYVFEAINASWEQLMGRTPEEVIGRRGTEIFPGLREQEWDPVEHLGRIALQGGEGSFEVYFRPTRQWISIYAHSPKRGECTVMFSDITRQKEAEERLQESERRLALALRASGSAVWEMDVASGMVTGEERLFSMVGYAPGDLKTMGNWFSLVHPEDVAGVPERVADVIEGRSNHYHFEARLRTKSGKWCWNLSQGVAAERDADGRATRLVGTHTSIDERKQAEEALRLERSRLQAILDNAPILISMKDMEGRMVLANRAVFDNVPLPPPDACLGRSIFELFPPEVAAVLWENDQAAIRSGGPVKVEETVIHQDGTPHVYLTVKFPVRDIQSALLTGVCAISTDITERKLAEAQVQRLNGELDERVKRRTAELERSNEALLQSNLELQRFAYIASHDLQTPLRTIVGFSQLLQQQLQGRLVEEEGRLLDRLIEAAHRMHRLIQDLLAYSRVETQARPFAPVDMNELLPVIELALDDSIRSSGAVITHDPLPVVQGDRGQLTRLLQNLIENGIKYHGEGAPRIHVGAERRDREWVFSVRDNGIGIDPRHFDRIFEIFQRLHSQRAYPGTGIGLAVCRRVVERHGGRLWVESVPGEGSTFHFTLAAPFAG